MSQGFAKSGEPLVLGVLGLGHVGLPTALGLAGLGWPVVGADDDQEKAQRIGRGEAPFYEDGLEEALRTQLDSGRFQVAPDVPAAVRQSTVLFVCVGTPQREDGSADLTQVERVARTVAQHLNGYKLVVEKSTTPVSTAEQIKRIIARSVNGDHEFEVAVNPEFLREGTALHDFLNPDRIVLGVESTRGRDLLLRVYQPLIDRDRGATADRDRSGITAPDYSSRRVVVTDLRTAELIKHASNAFLATKISFINGVADLCEAVGADVVEVAKGLGMDPRIGPDFLRAGLGFGGYCLPKDVRAFIRIGEDHGVDQGLLKAVCDLNDGRVERLVSRLREAVTVLDGKVLAIWGLAFKPGTDDIREARSLKVVDRLLDEGASLRLFDPKAMPQFREVHPEVPGRLDYCDSPVEASRGANAIVLVTEWPELREVDLRRIRDEMALPVIVDGRNFLDAAQARRLGFQYYGMGR